MKLGIDVDGVCAQWTMGAREMLNERFGLDLNIYKESDTWDEIEDIVTKEQWAWLWTAGVERGMFAKLRMFPGTHDALKYLSEKHEITLITHRPIKAAGDTFWWVSQHLGDISIRGIHVTKEKWEIPCDIYLDDKPENVQEIFDHRPSAITVIRTRQYNKNFRWPWRVDGWEQFVRFVEERED